MLAPARESMQRTSSSPLLFKSVFRDAEIVHELVKGGGGDGTAPFAKYTPPSSSTTAVNMNAT